MRILYYLLIVFCFFFSQLLFSQQADTLVRKPILHYFSKEQFEYKDSVTYSDNSLYNFAKYLNKNNLGNNGLPFTDLVYPLNGIETVGFNYSRNAYTNYFFTPENLKFYNTRTPYTDLLYVVGSKREQLFKMNFSYNVTKNWNFTAYFNRVRSDGFYQRQNATNNHLAITSNYKSLSNRYYVLAGVAYNKIKIFENGGVFNDSAFLAVGNIDKQRIGINLSSAKRMNTNRTAFVQQYVNLGQKNVDTITGTTIQASSRIRLLTSYEDNALRYEDDAPWRGYYADIYFDSTRTTDTTFYRKFENELSWKRVDNQQHRGLQDMLGIGVNVKHQLIAIQQRELFRVATANTILGPVNTIQQKIDTLLDNVIAGIELYNTYTNNKFWWSVSAKLGVSGYNSGDHYVGATGKKLIGDSLATVVVKLEDKLQAPDFIYNRYLSNHFLWNNAFGKSGETRVSFNFLLHKSGIAFMGSYSNYTDVLYFNDSAIAMQDKGAIPLLSLGLKKDFVIANWHLNNKINYQQVSAASVMRVPQLVLEHFLYYEKDVFKRAMRLQVGASVYYFTSYYGNGYMPASGQFYVQNKRKTGGYPFLDFFISAKIKTVRLFFKIDHLNSGLMGNDYMIVPYYPLNDRAFKFGVSWMFYD